MENVTAGFSPKPWARSAHLQTIFASLKYRLKGRNEMADCAQETILEGFDGSRLLGYLSRCEAGKAKGLVLLIHGWEGSSDSTYILSTGRYLFKNGYDDSVNLRTMPEPSPHPGLFTGTDRRDPQCRDKCSGLSDGKPFSWSASHWARTSRSGCPRHSVLAVPTSARIRHQLRPRPHQALFPLTEAYTAYSEEMEKVTCNQAEDFPELYDFRNC